MSQRLKSSPATPKHPAGWVVCVATMLDGSGSPPSSSQLAAPCPRLGEEPIILTKHICDRRVSCGLLRALLQTPDARRGKSPRQPSRNVKHRQRSSARRDSPTRSCHFGHLFDKPRRGTKLAKETPCLRGQLRRAGSIGRTLHPTVTPARAPCFQYRTFSNTKPRRGLEYEGPTQGSASLPGPGVDIAMSSHSALEKKVRHEQLSSSWVTKGWFSRRPTSPTTCLVLSGRCRPAGGCSLPEPTGRGERGLGMKRSTFKKEEKPGI